MKQEAGILQLLQSGAESGDEVRGQLLNKSHCIGKQNGPSRFQRQSADRGVERGEKARGGEHA